MRTKLVTLAAILALWTVGYAQQPDPGCLLRQGGECVQPRDPAVKPNNPESAPDQPRQAVDTFQVGPITVTETTTVIDAQRSAIALKLVDESGDVFELDMAKLADPAYLADAKARIEASPAAQEYRRRLHRLAAEIDRPIQGQKRLISVQETRFLLHNMMLDFASGDVNAGLAFGKRWTERGGYRPIQITPQHPDGQNQKDCYTAMARAINAAVDAMLACMRAGSQFFPTWQFYLVAPYQMSCQMEYMMRLASAYGQGASCAALGQFF